ncbi:A disintegrin and metallo ase with thrombospondin motifs [Brachionus plicatilis]|uniref:A disintegrin and metallo ase with thrombospondin motifs n=1 Tax=Brachionus plicatilis TaxID=10195 RepID=A0A3M7RB34_BRAPC|nr:A disintegrin and metallo ase with thrombospondin motifs [Brachionus plicatilis]
MRVYFSHLMHSVDQKYQNSFKNDLQMKINILLTNFLFLTDPLETTWADSSISGDPQYPTYDGKEVIVANPALIRFRLSNVFKIFKFDLIFKAEIYNQKIHYSEVLQTDLSHPGLGPDLRLVSFEFNLFLSRLKLVILAQYLKFNFKFIDLMEKISKIRNHFLVVIIKDLWGQSNSGPEQRKGIAGLAYLDGTCTSNRYSISEENGGFSSIYTIAHELGHNLGSVHDGEKGAEACPLTDYFIMTPVLKFEKIQNMQRFSSCSIAQFKSLLISEGCTREKIFAMTDMLFDLSFHLKKKLVQPVSRLMIPQDSTLGLFDYSIIQL